MAHKLVLQGYKDGGTIKVVLPLPERFIGYSGTIYAAISDEMTPDEIVSDVIQQNGLMLALNSMTRIGRKINAIKFLRHWYQGFKGEPLGLKKAKDFVEANCECLPPPPF